MQRAWAEVERLIRANARHRGGVFMGNVPDDTILDHAEGELEELTWAPNDPSELADLLGVLIHYAVKHGWTMEQLEGLMLEKFKARFTEPVPCSLCDGTGRMLERRASHMSAAALECGAQYEVTVYLCEGCAGSGVRSVA
jgi:hypothetical protein